MAFFKFNPEDIISTTFVAYPSYTFTFSNPLAATDGNKTAETIEIFTGGVGVRRYFEDPNGNVQVANYALSGSPILIHNTKLSSSERIVLDMLRNTYASRSFKKAYNYTSASLYLNSISASTTKAHTFNIPYVYYGSGIRRNSLHITDQTDHYFDDGYGGIYTASTLVGSVLYEDGVVLMGAEADSFFDSATTVNLYFTGTNKIPASMFLCRLPSGHLNFSTNPSYTNYNTTSKKNEIVFSYPQTFVTTVGIYDDEYKLLGVAKISSPILNEESSNLLVKIKMVY